MLSWGSHLPPADEVIPARQTRSPPPTEECDDNHSGKMSDAEGLNHRELKLHISHGKVVGVQLHEPVAKGVRLMRETGFSQLPVFNQNQVVGSLTEKIILEKLMSAPEPSDVSRQSIEKIMDEAFPSVGEETPVSMVSAILQYSPAVLVTKRGHVQGIITKADLLKVIGT